MPTVAETIREISREHIIKNKGLIFGQCLTAVGWIGGTIPELSEGLVECPMDDTFWVGLAAGASIGDEIRAIAVVRYQGFQWFNAVFFVNYAAKSKELWGIPCPMLMRSIAMDGGIGPVAGGSHHSMFMRMPGLFVYAPMTPNEWKSGWEFFMAHDDPMYVSEHRKSFPINYEMEDVIRPNADITLLPISSTRLNANDAAEKIAKEGITCNIVHQVWLKPFEVTEKILDSLACSRYGGIVIDGDFENGAVKCLAFDIMQKIDKKIAVLGLEDRTAGFAPHLDNLPPTSLKIRNKIIDITTK